MTIGCFTGGSVFLGQEQSLLVAWQLLLAWPRNSPVHELLLNSKVFCCFLHFVFCQNETNVIYPVNQSSFRSSPSLFHVQVFMLA